MSLGQILHIHLDQVKGEEPRACSTCRALQCLEALQRNSAGSCDKLQQPGAHLLVVPRHDLPEPDHLGALWCAVLQPRVAFPVLEVDSAQASDNQLELHCVKRFEEMLGDEFVKTLLQGEELLLNALHEPAVFEELHMSSRE